MDKREALAAGSILAGLVVLGLKFAAYWLTGSVALYSDALESTINVVTAIVAFWTIRVSNQPADADHPYGHTKAEYFSAVLILREAYGAFWSPRHIETAGPGLALSAVATAINLVWGLVLVRKGRAFRSTALVADGRHVLTDVYTSVGVIAGIAAAVATGYAPLDPILAGIVALNILWSGWTVMKESLGGLMDEAAPAETLGRIRDIISANADGALEAHDVRTRHAGRMTFIDFHLVVPGDMSVAQAHDICDCLEGAIRDELDGAVVTIHVEPENKAKHQGIVVL